MTSNIGARDLKDFGQGVGFATQSRSQQSDDFAKNVISKALKRTFSPEFLNRIDDVIIFNSLEKASLYKIIDIALKDVTKRIKELGFEIKLTDEAKEFLSDKGYDPQFGARPLHRAIQKYVEDPLAEEILRANAKPDDVFIIDLDKGADELKITHKAAKKKAETQAGDNQ
jgi:ATP-dependent Clp protease ATP-binding subunit ClpC